MENTRWLPFAYEMSKEDKETYSWALYPGEEEHSRGLPGALIMRFIAPPWQHMQACKPHRLASAVPVLSGSFGLNIMIGSSEFSLKCLFDNATAWGECNDTNPAVFFIDKAINAKSSRVTEDDMRWE